MNYLSLQQLSLIKKCAKNIFVIKNPTPEALKLALDLEVSFYELNDRFDLSEDIIVYAIELDEGTISVGDLKLFTKRVLITLIKLNSDNIRYVSNPPEELQLLALNSIEFIENPTDKVLELGILKNPEQLLCLENVPLHLLRLVVEKDGNNIGYIPSPSLELQLLAADSEYFSLDNIKNPYYEVIVKAITTRTSNIMYVENSTEELQLLALDDGVYAIRYIKNPVLSVQLRFIEMTVCYDSHGMEPYEDIVATFDQEIQDLGNSLIEDEYYPEFYDVYHKYIKDYPFIARISGLPVYLKLRAQKDTEIRQDYGDFDIEFSYQ